MTPTEEKIYLNGLNIVYCNSYKKIFPLIKDYLTKEEAFSFKNIWNSIAKKEKIKIDLEKEWQKLEKEGIDLITINNSLYPLLLKQIPYPPFGIYVKGKLTDSILNLAVVGTRKPSDYGKIVVQKIIKELISYGIVIVSGLAYGIDTIAHKSALENNGKTIAVLASGLNKITPVINKKLSSKIIKNGALISEYHPDFPSLKHNFAWRNRIISGLSIGTLVIEAKEKSGALITANFAFQQKRKVFAIPGSIFNENSVGCNNLIKKGAKLITIAEDIIEEIDKSLLKKKIEIIKNQTNLTENEKLILNFLSKEKPISLDKILEITNLKANEAMVILTELELKGLIQETNNGNYLKK